jgi:hypothetical protein
MVQLTSRRLGIVVALVHGPSCERFTREFGFVEAHDRRVLVRHVLRCGLVITIASLRRTLNVWMFGASIYPWWDGPEHPQYPSSSVPF